MNRSTTIEPAGPAVFAGIDYHKAFSVVSVGDENGTLIEQRKLSNNEEAVRKFFQERAPLKCVIENCRGNEWFTEIVRESGCSIVVSNTYAVRLIADSKRKNDKIDSRILMDLLAKDYLPTCYQPTKAETELREQIRWRNKLVQTRTKYTNCAHALLDRRNHGSSLSTLTSRKRLMTKLAKARVLTEDRLLRLDYIFDLIEHFDIAIAEEDRKISEYVNQNADAQRLKTIPGIGDLTATLLIAELGDISRFQKSKQVANYFGLVPSLYSSAKTSRHGRITKQGSTLARRILVQAAWAAVRKCPVLRARYNRIRNRKSKNTAIVAIARILSEIAFRILRDGTVYDSKQLTLG